MWCCIFKCICDEKYNWLRLNGVKVFVWCLCMYVYVCIKIPLHTDAAAQRAQDARPRVQAPVRFLLALPVAAHLAPIEIPHPHHQCDGRRRECALNRLQRNCSIVLSIQPGGKIRRYVHLSLCSSCYFDCHISANLRLPSLWMASFERAITCWFVILVSFLRSWKVSFLSFANKSIGGTLARTNTALVDTVRYAKAILRPVLSVPRKAFFWIVWLL